MHAIGVLARAFEPIEHEPPAVVQPQDAAAVTDRRFQAQIAIVFALPIGHKSRRRSAAIPHPTARPRQP